MPTRLFEPGADDVLYIVDISGYIFRAYHAIAPLTSPAGEPTNATFGTVTMLERLVRDQRPAMLAVAMDAGRDTFRREIYPDYKANRPPPPEDLKQQIARCEEILAAFAVPIYRTEGVEADDLIASLVARARDESVKVVIVSADKDLTQLVGDDVVMWDSMRDKVYGPEEVEQRHGVPPAKMRDLLALMGDTSDNVPGVPSVGPKTAKTLLDDYGTLEGVLEHVDEIKRKKLRETLIEHREQALISQKLVTLRADCEVDFDPKQLRWGGRDTDRLLELYEELGFQRQLQALRRDTGEADELRARGEQRVPRKPEAPPPPEPPANVAYETVLDDAALEALAKRIREAGRVTVDTETSSLDAMRADLIGIALSWQPGSAAYVPLAHRYVGAPKQLSIQRLRDVLGPVLADEDVGKGGHNLKFDTVVLARHELVLRGTRFDSLLAHYLLDPEAAHGLKELASAELALEMTSYDEVTHKSRKGQLDFDAVEVDEATQYSAADADAVLRLWDRLAPRLADEKLRELFDDIELPLSELLASMELVGVRVDTELLKRLGKEVDAQLVELEKRAHGAAGKEFNVNSPRQLETILFDDVGLKPIKRTKTSRSTDAATLEALADRHPLPAIILEHRGLAKLKGTYIDALPELVHPKTGRIHTKWGQAVAATGRLSSSDPNLQNIPIRSELGRKIRAAFTAPEGTCLVSADYSQIELRVLAHLSGDPVLIDAFRNDQDVHQRTAMEIFDLKRDDVDAEHRRRAKAVNFGVIYGQGENGLAKSLGISRGEARSFIKAYFERYSKVREFMDETLERARAGGSVSTLLGRRRLLPDIHSPNRARRLAAERIAMNAPIQGSAADLLKLAMLALAEPPTPGTRMVLTVHDELVFEVPEAEVDDACAKIRAAMEGVHELAVPLVVDVGHGPNWSAAH